MGQLGQIGANWGVLGQIEAYWDKLGQIGANWDKMGQFRVNWFFFFILGQVGNQGKIEVNLVKLEANRGK